MGLTGSAIYFALIGFTFDLPKKIPYAKTGPQCTLSEQNRLRCPLGPLRKFFFPNRLEKWKNVNGLRSAILAARNLKKVLNAKLRTVLAESGWEK